MTTEEKLDRLTTIVDALAGTVVHHDNQIEALIKVGEDQAHRLNQLIKAGEEQSARMAALEKRWEAYLNTIRPQ
jgi:hypothetical protein